MFCYNLNMFKNTAAKVLVVDDEASIRSLIQRRLERIGYSCDTAPDGETALELVKGGRFDLIITDINMPRMNGVELLRAVREIDETVSVIMVTAIMDMDTAIKSLKDGAYDYITKPIEHEKLVLSVSKALEKTRLLRENMEYQSNLERMVRERTAELEEKSLRLRKFFVETTMALVSAIEAKDKYTEGHSRRVADYSRRLAVRIGLSDQEAERIYVAGVLHDIGKIGIPDRILQKPGYFNDEERSVMQTHPKMSADILAKIEDFNDILEMVLHHHERFDGAGYPGRIAGENIPVWARVLSVADAFDAMTSQRPYRPSLSLSTAINEIQKGRGSQLDPEIAGEFLLMIDSRKLADAAG